MTDTRQALPPLPKPGAPNIWGGCFTAEQMQAYARAALSAQPVAGAVAEPTEFDEGDGGNCKVCKRPIRYGELCYEHRNRPAPEPSAQGEPVAWRYSVQPQVLGPSYWVLSETKDVPEAQPLYASAPSTPPPAVVEAVPLNDRTKGEE